MNTAQNSRVRARLKELTQKDRRLSINEIRVVLALERAIARLVNHSRLAQHLIFKGGYVLFKVHQSVRFTRDADALAISISQDDVRKLVLEALSSDLQDGFWFGDVRVEELPDQGQYGAYRFDIAFQIGTPDLEKIHKLSRIHIDIGFSDTLSIVPRTETMQTLLGEPISWRVYPPEHIVAEKLQTLFERGSANSRAKDVHDLVYLYPRCKSAQDLWSAIGHTFSNRGTSLPSNLFERALEFDQQMLKTAWPGIRILDKKVSFEDCWNSLMEFLKQLDEKRPR